MLRGPWARRDGRSLEATARSGAGVLKTGHASVDGVDLLTAFGLASVGAMLACYAFEERSPYFVLGFALACWATALYGWLSGAWPFTLVEAIWGVVALRRFASKRAGGSQGVVPLR